MSKDRNRYTEADILAGALGPGAIAALDADKARERATRGNADPSPAPSKYRAQATVVDGIRFASKREARVYADLVLQRQAGVVKWFIMQAPFRLPGKTTYRADFLVVMADHNNSPGVVRVIDAKGIRTQMYKLKKRQVEALYPVEIEEV